MKSLMNLISEIFDPHMDTIKQHIANEILGDVVDIVLEDIFEKMAKGTIKLTGYLNKDEILENCIKHFKEKESE
jgi:hypothetical protein